MTCAACAGLRAEIKQLREENAQLRRVLAPAANPIPVEWGLTAAEAGTMLALLDLELASKEQIYDRLYGLRIDDPPALKIIDVFVCKLRRKVAAYGIEIETVWGRGYRLRPDQRAAMRREGR